jgi:hypothetical protein
LDFNASVTRDGYVPAIDGSGGLDTTSIDEPIAAAAVFGGNDDGGGGDRYKHRFFLLLFLLI